MSSQALAQSVKRSELVIGLVTPVGTRTADLADGVRAALNDWGYRSVVLHLSEELDALGPEGELFDDRVRRLMAAGNDFCSSQVGTELDGGRAAMARLAISRIRRKRVLFHRQDGRQEAAADLAAMSLANTAFIIHSLKRPHEVELLREVYGNHFILIGAQGSMTERLAEITSRPLSGEPERKEAVARELMRIDAKDGEEHGQRMNDTYPLADYFLSTTDSSRVFDLLFGLPVTPTPEEYGMYVARAASGRSLAATRKVGASLVMRDTVVATGYNDVPAGHISDVVAGTDVSEQFKRENVRDTIVRLVKADLIADTDDLDGLLDAAGLALRGGQLMSVIEYQRAVHAEAKCLDDALVRGVTPVGGKLLVTTFPCHLCFKHCLSAEIAEIRYIEPYPKSRTQQMYPELGAKILRPYEGVAPGMYNRLFVERAPFLSDEAGKFTAPEKHQAKPALGVEMKDRDRDAAERLAVGELSTVWQ